MQTDELTAMAGKRKHLLEKIEKEYRGLVQRLAALGNNELAKVVLTLDNSDKTRRQKILDAADHVALATEFVAKTLTALGGLMMVRDLIEGTALDDKPGPKKN